jgi:hypothetical protein
MDPLVMEIEREYAIVLRALEEELGRRVSLEEGARKELATILVIDDDPRSGHRPHGPRNRKAIG